MHMTKYHPGHKNCKEYSVITDLSLAKMTTLLWGPQFISYAACFTLISKYLVADTNQEKMLDAIKFRQKKFRKCQEC